MSTLSRVGKLAALDGAIQGACFIVAAALQTEMFYDFSGSCTYLAMAIFALRDALKRQGTLSPRQIGAATMACVWASRLGSFLLQRILQDGRDSRFDKVSNAMGVLRPCVLLLLLLLLVSSGGVRAVFA